MVEVHRSPADWRAKDLAARTDWLHHFTPAEDAEIKRALAVAKERGRGMETLTREDFPLPTVADRLAHARDVLETRW